MPRSYKEWKRLRQGTSRRPPHVVRNENPGEGRIILYVDGGLLGHTNPCPEGVYWSVYLVHPTNSAHDRIVIRRAQSTNHHTNNDAEWLALIAALSYAQTEWPQHHVLIRSDSQLVVKQFNGLWANRVERLHRLMLQAQHLAKQLAPYEVHVRWCPRKELVHRVGH